MTPELVALLKHLEHASAEINTAIREGFYVHMGIPTVQFSLGDIEITMNDDKTEVLAVEYPNLTIDVRLNYEIVPLDEKRIKTVDHRDALSRRRSPEYQPPGNIS